MTDSNLSHAKRRLSVDDINALAQIARNFVEANERRNPESTFPTINELDTFQSLRWNIDSLLRNRSV